MDTNDLGPKNLAHLAQLEASAQQAQQRVDELAERLAQRRQELTANEAKAASVTIDSDPAELSQLIAMGTALGAIITKLEAEHTTAKGDYRRHKDALDHWHGSIHSKRQTLADYNARIRTLEHSRGQVVAELAI